MIKSIIVEDEWYTLEDIKSLVKTTGFIEVCASYQDPIAALRECKSLMPQLAFIDIEMPNMDGLSLAESLLEINPFLKVVFLTAYNQYAVQAFEINALDYIMKPINTERFAKLVDKLKKTFADFESIDKVLNIQCFGDFEVKIDGLPVKWERTKTEELFAYLLVQHNKKVHKDVIVEALWPNYEPSKALAILQTSACKLRNIFGRVAKLEYESSRYCLTILDCRCDLFDIERILEQDELGNRGKLEQLTKLCDIMSKGLMISSGYIWLHAMEFEIKRAFISKVKSIENYYRRNNEQELVQQYCQLIDRISSYDE